MGAYLTSRTESLVVGCSLPLVSAVSRKWGKRPVMLISAVFGFGGSVMGAIWTSFDGLLISRIVQGGSVAAFESVAISMIGDLYFVHERGFYMALMQFLLGATSNFTAVIAGPITAELGWEWLFYLLVSELPNTPRARTDRNRFHSPASSWCSCFSSFRRRSTTERSTRRRVR